MNIFVTISVDLKIFYLDFLQIKKDSVTEGNEGEQGEEKQNQWDDNQELFHTQGDFNSSVEVA